MVHVSWKDTLWALRASRLGRLRYALLGAIRAPLKFPVSLHRRVVAMRCLDTDKVNDPLWVPKAKWWNAQLVQVARQLSPCAGVTTATVGGIVEGRP